MYPNQTKPLTLHCKEQMNFEFEEDIMTKKGKRPLVNQGPNPGAPKLKKPLNCCADSGNKGCDCPLCAKTNYDNQRAQGNYS